MIWNPRFATMPQSDLEVLQFERLQAGYPYGMFAVPTRKVVLIHSCAGTAGPLTVVGTPWRDLESWVECVARLVTAGGVSLNPRLAACSITVRDPAGTVLASFQGTAFRKNRDLLAEKQ
jgi:phenylacetate-coenzyme A ligase PaaK-like adenylate-forming protein